MGTSTDTISFSDVLAALNGETTLAQTALGQAQTQSGLAWQDLQSFIDMGALFGLEGITAGQSTDAEGLESIIAQLMAMLQGETGTAQGAEGYDETLALMAKMQKMLQQSQTENGEIMAGEQMLLLMALVSEEPLVPVAGEDGTLTLTLPEGNNALETLMTSSPEALVQQLAGTAQNAATAQTQDAALFQVAQNPDQTPAQSTQAQQPQAPQAQQNAPAFGQAVQGAETQAAQSGVEAEFVQQPAAQTPVTQFETAVQTAKQQIEAQPAAQQVGNEADDGLDIDRLQQQVDDGVFMQNTAFAPQTQTAAAEAPPAPLYTQLQEGILKAMQQGEESFSIKLNPENLGEVELRLTKTDEGGMLLNLVVKNGETQRMLAAELNSLQEALKPLNVQVAQVSTNQQDAYSQARQEFFDQNRQGWQNTGQPTFHATRASAQASDADAEQAVPVQLSGAVNAGYLNTYI